MLFKVQIMAFKLKKGSRVKYWREDGLSEGEITKHGGRYHEVHSEDGRDEEISSLDIVEVKS